MEKLDRLSIPMIMGDWRITIQSLEQQLSIKMAVGISLHMNNKVHFLICKVYTVT